MIKMRPNMLQDNKLQKQSINLKILQSYLLVDRKCKRLGIYWLNCKFWPWQKNYFFDMQNPPRRKSLKLWTHGSHWISTKQLAKLTEVVSAGSVRFQDYSDDQPRWSWKRAFQTRPSWFRSQPLLSETRQISPANSVRDNLAPELMEERQPCLFFLWFS